MVEGALPVAHATHVTGIRAGDQVRHDQLERTRPAWSHDVLGPGQQRKLGRFCLPREHYLGTDHPRDRLCMDIHNMDSIIQPTSLLRNMYSFNRLGLAEECWAACRVRWEQFLACTIQLWQPSHQNLKHLFHGMHKGLRQLHLPRHDQRVQLDRTSMLATRQRQAPTKTSQIVTSQMVDKSTLASLHQCRTKRKVREGIIAQTIRRISPTISTVAQFCNVYSSEYKRIFNVAAGESSTCAGQDGSEGNAGTGKIAKAIRTQNGGAACHHRSCMCSAVSLRRCIHHLCLWSAACTPNQLKTDLGATALSQTMLQS